MKKLSTSYDAILRLKASHIFKPKLSNILKTTSTTMILLMMVFGFFGYTQNLLNQLTYIFTCMHFIMMITYMLTRVSLEYQFMHETKTRYNPYLAISIETLTLGSILLISQRMIGVVVFNLLFAPVLNIIYSILALLSIGLIIYMEYGLHIKKGLLKTVLVTSLMFFLVQVSLTKLLFIANPVISYGMGFAILIVLYMIKLILIHSRHVSFILSLKYDDLTKSLIKIALSFTLVMTFVLSTDTFWPFDSKTTLTSQPVVIDLLELKGQSFLYREMMITKDYMIFSYDRTYVIYRKNHEFGRTITLNLLDQLVVMGDDLYLILRQNETHSSNYRRYEVRKLNESLEDDFYMTRWGVDDPRVYKAYIFEDVLLWMNSQESYVLDDGLDIYSSQITNQAFEPFEISYQDSYSKITVYIAPDSFFMDLRSNYHTVDQRYIFDQEKQHKIVSQGYRLQKIYVFEESMFYPNSIEYVITSLDDVHLSIKLDVSSLQNPLYFHAFFYRDGYFYILSSPSGVINNPVYYTVFDIDGHLVMYQFLNGHMVMDHENVYLFRSRRFFGETIYEVVKMDITHAIDDLMVPFQNLSEVILSVGFLLLFVVWNRSLFQIEINSKKS